MTKVSIVVPAHNEEENIPVLVERLIPALEKHDETRDYEVVIVNDNSRDGTGPLIDRLARENPRIRAVHRKDTPGFGNAVRTGLKSAAGDIIIPVMADLSDDPNDIPAMVRKIDEGYDIAYGSRFCPGGTTNGYPWKKMIANRAFNNTVRLLFGIHNRDVTNAFKAYRRKVLETIGIDSLEANGFDLTVEIPLKAHVLGFKSVEVPVSWTEREKGEAKLKLSQNGTRYGKRLLNIFLVGNAMSLRDIFGAITRGSPLYMILAILIGLILLFGVFSLAGFSEVFKILSGVSLVYVALGCLAILTTFILRTWRWSILLRSSGYRVHVDNAFKCIMFGWMINYIFPLRIGDFARGFTLKTTEDTPLSVGLSTIVIERAMDMLTLAAILLVAVYMLTGNGEQYLLAIISLGVAVALIAGLVVLYKAEGVFDRILRGKLAGYRETVRTFRRSLDSMFGNPQAIILAILLSFPIWLFEVASIYFAAKALHFDLSAALSVLVGIIAFIAQAIPTTPAGIGVHEGVIAGTLKLWGIDISIGTSIALVDHFARGVIIFIFGAISAIHIGFESRTYFTTKNAARLDDKHEE